MKQDYCHICVVLDASGSMECIKRDTQGSFNSFIDSQKKEEGKTVFDLFQFNTEVTRPVKSADLSKIDHSLMDRYQCCGGTALHDAICIAIDTLGQEFAAMPEEERPESVIVAILTDGEENSSRRFSAEDVKKRIEHQRDVYSWEFMFLAANQDACTVGGRLGMRMDDCAGWVQSAAGMADVRDRMFARACIVREAHRRRREENDDT